MNRRTFIRRSCAAAGISMINLSPVSLLEAVAEEKASRGFQRSLPVPPLLDGTMSWQKGEGTAYFNLNPQRGEHQLIEEFTTPTMGYNGNYLGPTLKVKNGQNVAIDVHNQLNQRTTVHWHGLHVPAEFDGGPHQVIGPGEIWKPRFTIKQPAATLWYHPHAMGLTGEHVYMGLAGMFYIEDEVSERLALPKTYGVDDFPLILQDRRFFGDGTLAYVQSMRDVMHGVIGNIMVVNGVERPQLSVPQGLVRLRLLNGSNSSLYRVKFSDGRNFWQVATDGGFLEKPVLMTESLLSPGERAEILVDFGTDGLESMVQLKVDQFPGGTYEAMQFKVQGEKAKEYKVPEQLTAITWLRESDAVKTRKFTMETFSHGGRLTINGKNMDMNRVDEKVKLGTTEIWEIGNFSAGMMQMIHSMHLHDVQFQILDRNGKPPAPHERGRKDTVLIPPNETVRIIMRFEDYTGIYMYHCHLLEHEEAGMMGQFEVVR